MRADKFTTKFSDYLAEAQSLALAADHQMIEPEHVLFAMLKQEGGEMSPLLSKAGVRVQALVQALAGAMSRFPKVEGHGGEVAASRDLTKVLNLCDRDASKRGDQFISSELFPPACMEAKVNAGKLLTEHGATLDSIQKSIKDIRGGESVTGAEQESSRGALSKYTIDLTQRAQEGKIDPVIGRDEEIRRAIQVLQRRTKNNPVLIGEPGVGKTAIVEGLAQRIVNGEVPEGLKRKRLLMLDLASMIAGAKYRGEFEERLKGVLKELSKDTDGIVLFIDEIHTLVGAGKAEGAMDAGNMLKPALARGELHCVGATTLDEYRKNIEKDPALERRFQRVLIEEPSFEDTVAILRGLKEKYEVHHGVTITDPAIVTAADLSHRYITDRFLPDKAIDLIDEATSRIRIEMDSKPEVMDRLDRRLIQLKIEREAVKKESDEASKKRLKNLQDEIDKLEREYSDLEEVWKAEKAGVQEAQAIKEELDKLRGEMEDARRRADWSRMSEIQYGRIPQLEEKLAKAEELEGEITESPKLMRSQVGADEVAEIVSRSTGIPVQKLMGGEREKLLHMENELHRRVIGQDEAVDAVCEVIRRSRAGLSDGRRPWGSFLFLGPTGVGKTELCRTLADFLFDSEDKMIRIDMSEYMEKHSVARLIGAPPGYVGYDEGGQLSEQVRRKPYSLVLLDEVEKAHPDVFNVLLQVLDNGRLTDGQGRTVDFRNCVIVMTSNLGSHKIMEMSERPAEEVRDSVMEDARKFFRPEFINRLDEIVVFKSLQRDEIRRITRLQLADLQQLLNRQGLGLEVDDTALDYIAAAGFDPVYGARPLRRVIRRELESVLSKKIISGELPAGAVFKVSAKGEGLRVE